MDFFIGPADDSKPLPGAEVLLERVEATVDEPTSTSGSDASIYEAVVTGTLGGELIEVSVAKDGSSIVVDGSAAASAALAWALRDVGELQVYDEAYTVAVPVAEVGSEQELARHLTTA